MVQAGEAGAMAAFYKCSSGPAVCFLLRLVKLPQTKSNLKGILSSSQPDFQTQVGTTVLCSACKVSADSSCKPRDVYRICLCFLVSW